MSVSEPSRSLNHILSYLEQHKAQIPHFETEKDGRCYIYWGTNRLSAAAVESLIVRMRSIFVQQPLFDAVSRILKTSFENEELPTEWKSCARLLNELIDINQVRNKITDLLTKCVAALDQLPQKSDDITENRNMIGQISDTLLSLPLEELQEKKSSLSDLYLCLLEQLVRNAPAEENAKAIFPAIIECLMAKTKEGLFARSKGFSALDLAAIIGDVETIERLQQLLKNTFLASVNALSETLGVTPLHFAISSGNFEFAKALIQAGADINVPSKFFITPLFEAISHDNMAGVQFCLEQNTVDLSFRNAWNQNPLHLVVISKNLRLLQLLLTHPHLKKTVHEKDLFGHNPLDYALQGKFDGAIAFLGGNSAAVAAEKQVAQIDQKWLNSKLIKYLELKRSQDSRVEVPHPREILIDSRGHCHGWSFLFQYYASHGLTHEFYTIAELISKWDETEEGLLQEVSGRYKNVEEVMEQWVNDLVWFQHHDKIFHILGQDYRAYQFEIIKKNQNDHLEWMGENLYYRLSKEQLTEFLAVMQQFPGTTIEFAGEGHTTSCRLYPDGKMLYYDSNFPRPVAPFSRPEELATVIQNTKFKGLGKNSESMDFRFLIYRLESSATKDIEGKVPEALSQRSSPNHWSLLHLSILCNDLDLYSKTAKQPFLNSVDAHGITPIRLAVAYNRKKMAELLMDEPLLDLSPMTNGINLLDLTLSQGQYEMAFLLLKNKNYPLQGDELAKAAKNGPLEVLEAITASQSFDKSFLDRSNYLDGNTALHYAVKRKDQNMISFLINLGANPDQENFEHKTAAQLAAQLVPGIRIIRMFS